MLGISGSYWMDSAPGPSYPALAQDVTVDVAVIGAGIAGISAAWELVRSGYRVALCDSHQIAAGTTGHTTAKLTAAHGVVYAHLTSSLGDQVARLYAQSQLDAIARVERIADELNIDCELERLPAYAYCEDPGGVADLRAEAEAVLRAGLPATFTTEVGLPFPVAGAVRVDDQAQFHPRKYLLALTEAIARQGAQVFENTRVVNFSNDGPHVLSTDAGHRITAEYVVVATHYPIVNRASLFTRLIPHRELVVAAPISAAHDPHGMFITMEDNTRSVRTAPYRDGQRLLIVTGEHFTPGAADVTQRLGRLAGWMMERFHPSSLAYHWAAQDNATPDRVPYVGRMPGAEHMYVATGFRGWGMTNGVMSGHLICGLIKGEPPSWASIYDPHRMHITVEAGGLVKAAAGVAGHYVGDRVRHGEVGTVAELASGQGAVLRVGGERCAVYRDDDGRAHAVSAVCTHMGCVVGFNEVERSWDCPCHGSRFATDGSVLEGPATKPLAPRALEQ